MDDQKDSIARFLSELPNYEKDAYIDYVPYARATRVCSTREELQECLDQIYEAARKLNVDENYVMYFDHSCMEDFLIDKGEIQPDYNIPEEIQEIAELKEDNDEIRKRLKAMFHIVPSSKSSQTLSPINTDNDNAQHGLNDKEPLSARIFSKKESIEASKNTEQLGDHFKKLNIGSCNIELDFGEFSVDEDTGAINLPLGDNLSVRLCSHFVYPSAIIKSQSSETVNISYFRDDEWFTLDHIRKSDLYNPSKVGNLLLDSGLDVNVAKSEWLSKYFAELEKLNRNKYIHVYRTAESLGWKNNYHSFAPYGYYEHNGNSNLRRLFESITTQHGNMADWKNAIKEVRDAHHIPARIIIAASFASALIRPFDGMRFIIDIIGKSGIGKSVALRVAAGVWGDPDRYIARFDSTEGGSMLRSNYLSDLPLILDESETKKSKNDYDEFIYTMCGDYDRVKATNDNAPSISKNCIFISGEHNLLKDNSNAGAKNRVIDLVCDTYIFFDENRNSLFVPKINENYGYAGRELVKYLLEEDCFQHAKDIYGSFLERFPLNRQARIPAVILTADTLVDEWIFNDGIRLTPENIMPYLRTNQDKESQQGNETVQRLVDEWLRNELGENFNRTSKYGRIVNQRIFAFFSDDTLREIINKGAGDFDSYIKWAKENEKLATSKNAGNKYQLKVAKGDPDHSPRCYAVYLPLPL